MSPRTASIYRHLRQVIVIHVLTTSTHTWPLSHFLLKFYKNFKFIYPSYYHHWCISLFFLALHIHLLRLSATFWENQRRLFHLWLQGALELRMYPLIQSQKVRFISLHSLSLLKETHLWPTTDQSAKWIHRPFWRWVYCVTGTVKRYRAEVISTDEPNLFCPKTNPLTRAFEVHLKDT